MTPFISNSFQWNTCFKGNLIWPNSSYQVGNAEALLNVYNLLHNVRYLSNKSAFITKIKRKMYLRMYPTCVVQPDGSTYNIRYFQPRRIIKLPLDISTVSAELREEILEKRRPKKKVVIVEDINVNFNHNQYLKLLNKSKNKG